MSDGTNQAASNISVIPGQVSVDNLFFRVNGLAASSGSANGEFKDSKMINIGLVALRVCQLGDAIRFAMSRGTGFQFVSSYQFLSSNV